MRILLVEDNPVDRMFVTQALKHVDGFVHELMFSNSLEDAMETLRRMSVDIILLDLWLTDSQGLETCRRLVEVNRFVPIVVMTATDDRELAAEAIRSGAQDYLVKGQFPGAAIARVLEYAINRFHFRQELTHRDHHYQELLKRVPAIIWTTDRDMTITSSLGEGLKSLNLNPADFVGKTMAQLLRETEESPGAIESHIQALNGLSVSYEAEWLGRLFEIKIDPLYTADQTVSGTIGVALDVTDRRNLDREIHFAHLVQKGLLPAESPTVNGFEIFGGSHPAKQTCGDWFDYLALSDGSVGLVVGDVCGKGFGPAILSATISAYLESLAETHSDIRGILTTCNRMICRRGLNRPFAMLSLGRLQPNTRQLTYVGAGEGVLVVSRNGTLKQRIPASGIPLGLTEESPYDPAAQVALESGDILLMLTDGFREAANPNDKLFGESRIVETVATNSHSSAEGIFNSIRVAAKTFAEGNKQLDDMTGIVVKVTC